MLVLVALANTELTAQAPLRSVAMAVALALTTEPSKAYPSRLAEAVAFAITADVKNVPAAARIDDAVVATALTLAENLNQALALEMAVAAATTDAANCFAPVEK